MRNVTDNIICPRCKAIATNNAWDTQTKIIFGDDSEPVSNIIEGRKPPHDHYEYWYICPNCKEQIDSEDLKVVETED